MKTPSRVWHALRDLRFSPKEAEVIATIYKAAKERDASTPPWTIAHRVCANLGYSPAIWHEDLTRAFAENAKELMHA